MRLLLFNLMLDEADPALGFAVDWTRRLAERCDSVDILTMCRGRYSLPANTRVLSAGRERGWSKPARLARFYRLLLPLLAARRYDACFAHMMPLFAGLAGPLLTARGIPTTLWYTHRARSAQLRLGMAMSRRVVTAHASSFPYSADKLRVLGHGIDADFYAPAASAQPEPNLVVQVGRLSPIKHQATTIEALAPISARLALIGATPPGSPSDYEASLRDLADQLGMRLRCHFAGAVDRSEVRAWYRRASLAINASPPGLFDKAALESMACGLPTVVCNPAFAPLLGAHVDLLLADGPRDVRGLRERIEALLRLPPGHRAEIGAQLRENVLREHSLPQLIERLLSVLKTGEPPEPRRSL